ncbi:MAG: Na+/H+ antiporter NhaC family protein, partial [Bacteroidales bacterium]
MQEEVNDIKQKHRIHGWLALSPMAVFLCMYLVASIILNDFYKIPITVAFLFSSCYAVAITRGLPMEDRISVFSKGASEKSILLMVWIFILAGAFAQGAKQMGAIDSIVNLTLTILPGNLILAGIFLASCFISLSIGTSVGTIAALVPVATGLAAKTGIDLPYMTAVVVGGSFFGDNLSFISDTTIAATQTQDCLMKDKFRVNIQIILPAALISLIIYIIQGMALDVTPEIGEVK